VRAELIPLSEVSDRLISAWTDLAARAAEPNPFFEPYFVLPAARHLGRPGPNLLIAGEEGRLLACMPVIRGLLLRKVPAPHVASWRHLYAPLGTPLVDPHRAPEALQGVVDILRREARPHRVVVLEWIGQEGPVAAGLEAAFTARSVSPIVYRTFFRGTLRRPVPGQPPEGEARPSGRGHSRLRRLGRAFERELGGPLEIVDRSGQPEAVERFLALEASGWKGRRGTAMARRPGHAEFFREMCAGAATAGRLELLSMEAGGRVLAMKCSLLAGDALFYLKAAYDEAYARFSPGVQLELAAVDRFLAGGPQAWIDSCTNEANQTIQRLFPERRTLGTLIIPPWGSLGRMAVGTMLRLAHRSGSKGAGLHEHADRG
jgi:CelD/BcsL family acetyltransferase involved in cellulose biosynthesis